MSFLNATQMAQIVSLQDNVFDTFKEQIVLYKAPLKTYLAPLSEDNSYNFGFGNEQPTADATYITQSGSFYATISYPDKATSQQLAYNKGENPMLREGTIRICVSGQAAKDFMDSSEIIVVDGTDFRVSSDTRPRGMFRRYYFNYYLTKIEGLNP